MTDTRPTIEVSAAPGGWAHPWPNVAGFKAGVDAETLVEAAAPVLKRVAVARGFADVAVFGSVARHQARLDSDIDLLVRPPAGAAIEDLTALRRLFERILGRSVDVVSYGGLTGLALMTTSAVRRCDVSGHRR